MAEHPTQRGLVCDPDRDGIDHINVYTRGRTELGRLITNPSRLHVEMPLIGRFGCIESLWFWVSTGACCQSLRTCVGLEAKVLANQLKLKRMYVADFEEIIKYATAWRIDHHDVLREKFFHPDNNQPFLHYYVYGQGDKKVVRTANSSLWTIDYLKLLREGGREFLQKELRDNKDHVEETLRSFLKHVGRLHEFEKGESNVSFT